MEHAYYYVMWYPFKGIGYFVTRTECWWFFWLHLKPLIIVSLIAYAIMIPLMFFLWTITSGSAMLVLPSIFQSCNFVINFINKKFILPKTMKKLFDHVIVSHMKLRYNKLPNGVLHSYLPGYYGETPIGKICRYCIQSACPLTWITYLILCFFINMIPLFGPFLVILIRASRSGFSKHHRYFQLKGYTNSQIYFIWTRQKHQYFIFGLTTLILEIIPFLGYLFTFTNSIGAAFWAVDIEDQLCKNVITRMQDDSDEEPSDLECSSSEY